MGIEDREKIRVLREYTQRLEDLLKTEFKADPPLFAVNPNTIRIQRMRVNDILNAKRKKVASSLVNQDK